MPLPTDTDHTLQTIASPNRGPQDVTPMSDIARITRLFCKAFANGTTRRTRLASLALFWLAVAMAPQVTAQACGASLTLSANRWTMVGIPCVPPSGRRTVGDVFGPSLGTANYGVTWIVWKRVYNDNQCVVSSGPSDCYVKLTLASPANTGDAFWVYTTVQKAWQLSSSTTATPGPYFEYPAILSTDGNSRYFMFANTYSGTVSWSNIVFPSIIFGFFPFNLSSQQAVNNSVVSKNVHYWNGNTYFTRDLSNPVATFPAKTAAWLEMLQPSAAISNVRVRIPQP